MYEVPSLAQSTWTGPGRQSAPKTLSPHLQPALGGEKGRAACHEYRAEVSRCGLVLALAGVHLHLCGGKGKLELSPDDQGLNYFRVQGHRQVQQVVTCLQS